MDDFLQKKPTILIVEDDLHVRSFLESSLKHSGYEVLATDSAEAAQNLLINGGSKQIHAVVSDYRLPGMSGTDLLKWIRSVDISIASLIITGQGEKSIVEESLSVGAFEYLEKPITHRALKSVISKAVKKTSELRKIESDREGLLALENLDQDMNIRVPENLKERLAVVYRPLHEVGGDFLITHDYGNGQFVLLVGDISGHDIRSGFVSTYFQGYFKGSLESGCRIEKALEFSNRSLKARIESPGSSQDLISLALSAIDIGPKDDYIQHWNFGLTPCCTITENGRILEQGFGQFPLGWLQEINTRPVRILLRNQGLLYIFTDGLIEFAELLKINTFSLLYRFLHELNLPEDLPVLAQDDILIIRYSLKNKMAQKEQFEPILSEHYSGTEVDHIDKLQSNWRRSISFALEDRLGDRLYDLLICIREGMINALTHGCESSPEKFAHLQISLNDQKDLLRVYIDDPGKGHDFNLEERLSRINRETGKNLGLGIVQHLSDSFKIENQGTSLVFDFQIKPEDQ